MRSKWFHLKDKAITLRRKGNSIPSIEAKLGIPRSTLSGWLQSVPLTTIQKQRLYNNWKNGLVKARKKAVLWHNAQKANRLLDAQQKADQCISNIDLQDVTTVELALALLYMGEGSKISNGTSIGNSDPLILRFFVVILIKIYKISISQIKADLHLRADQNPVQLKSYWSKSLGLPIQNFISVIFDKRTKGKPTYDRYKGVCLIRCGHSEVQRKLIFLSRSYCEKIIQRFTGT